MNKIIDYQLEDIKKLFYVFDCTSELDFWKLNFFKLSKNIVHDISIDNSSVVDFLSLFVKVEGDGFNYAEMNISNSFFSLENLEFLKYMHC